MQKIRFDMGEERHVRLLIHSAGDTPFVIRSASWSLTGYGDVRESGECEIIDHIIDAYITAPARRTVYRLTITYVINDETLVEQLELEVV